MDLPALGITLDLPPYVRLSGGWSAEATQDSATYVLTGKNGSTWRRIEVRGSEPRVLDHLVIDHGGYLESEAVYREGYPVLPEVTYFDTPYLSAPNSLAGAWQQNGRVMDLLAADGTAIRHKYDTDGVEDSRKRGTWAVTDTNLLSILIDEDFDPVDSTWSVRAYTVDRKWRFNLINGILYRGGMTRIGSSTTTFFDSFTDAVYDDASSTWMKRELTIDNTGAVTFAMYASTDPEYESNGEFVDGEGTWGSGTTYTATTTGLPTAPVVGVLYDFSLVNVDIPDVVDGMYQILMHDKDHIAVMPEGMSR